MDSKKIFELIERMLPVLLVAKVVDPIIGMLAMPVLIYVFGQLQSWWNNRQTREYTMVFESESTKPIFGGRVENKQFNAIVEFIRDVVKMPDCVLKISESCVTSTLGKDYVMTHELTMHSINGSAAFTYKGERYTVKLENVNETKKITSRLIISCRESDVMTRLLGDANAYYIKNHYSRQHRSDAITTNTVVDGRWHATLEYNTKTFDHIYIDADTLQRIRKDVENFRDSRVVYAKNCITYKRGYVFHGPPGTGKSSLGYAIARHLDYDIYRLALTRIENLTKFQLLISEFKTPCVVVIDDIETSGIVTGDTTANKTSVAKVGISDLLELFDGYGVNIDGIVFVITTNSIASIDKRLLRAGRIDEHYEIGYPSSDTIGEMFRRVFGKCPRDLPPLENATMSDILHNVVLPNISSVDHAVDAYRKLAIRKN